MEIRHIDTGTELVENFWSIQNSSVSSDDFFSLEKKFDKVKSVWYGNTLSFIALLLCVD
jgi:hypothetical protein